MNRSHTVIIGVLLGCATVGSLTLLAVLGLRPDQPPVPVPRPPEVATGPQPRTALLAGPQPPASFAPSATVSPPLGRTEAHDGRCQALLADPAGLLTPTPTPGPASHASVRRHTPDRATLEQAVRLLSLADARRAYTTLLDTARACPDFTAYLDGVEVRVRLADGAAGRPIVGDSYSVRLTVTSAGHHQTGYLTVGRIGVAVSVLRRLGPADPGDQPDSQVGELLERTLDRILPLSRATPVPGAGA
jgi:hypothetical protein